MPIDIEAIRDLPAYELNHLKERLSIDVDEAQAELSIVERKLKTAMMDESTRHSDLSPLLCYREEIRQVFNRVKRDLDQLCRLLQGGHVETDAAPLVNSTTGQGVVYIRGDDAKTQKIPGVKTFKQILDAEKDEKDRRDILEFGVKMKKAEEFKNLEDSKKQSQRQPQTQTQTA